MQKHKLQIWGYGKDKQGQWLQPYSDDQTWTGTRRSNWITFLNFMTFGAVLVYGHIQVAQLLFDAHTFQESEQKPCNHPGGDHSKKGTSTRRKSVTLTGWQYATLSPEGQGEVTAGDRELRTVQAIWVMTNSKCHVSDKVQANNSVQIQFLQALSAEG